MLKSIVSIVTFFLVAVLFPGAVSGHFLRAESGLSLELHIEPDDDPATNEKTTLSLDFTDANQKFQIEQCDCWVYLIQDQKVVDSSIIEKSAQGDVSQIGKAIVTFPTKSVYQIRVIGKPIVQDGFANFDFNYDFRVERDGVSPEQTEVVEPSEATRNLNGVGIFLGGLAVVSIISFLYFRFLPIIKKRRFYEKIN